MLRPGDTIPHQHDLPVRLCLHRPVRWLPRHGQPVCAIEWVTQHTLKTVAFPVVYAALLLIACLLVYLLA